MIELSVIIPMYKGKEYIKSTVSEVLKIGCTKEVLVIDDGSQDGSYEYAVDLFSGNDEVIVIKKENGGIADTRNYGLNRAVGKYILFVDHDDRINPETITEAVIYMNEKEYSAVMWTTMFEYQNHEVKICDDIPLYIGIITLSSIMVTLPLCQS